MPRGQTRVHFVFLNMFCKYWEVEKNTHFFCSSSYKLIFTTFSHNFYVFCPRGPACVLTSSIICGPGWLWFPFHHLISSISHELSIVWGTNKWQWYIRCVTETKGWQGLCFCSHWKKKKNCDNTLCHGSPSWHCIKNSQEPRNLSAPSAASADWADWGVGKDPIKMHCRKWDLGEPCEKPCM